jgi:hypothetical protein
MCVCVCVCVCVYKIIRGPAVYLPQTLPSADDIRHKFHVWNSRFKPDNVSATQHYETELHIAK